MRGVLRETPQDWGPQSLSKGVVAGVGDCKGVERGLSRTGSRPAELVWRVADG